jgi:hypothetical protein
MGTHAHSYVQSHRGFQDVGDPRLKKPDGSSCADFVALVREQLSLLDGIRDSLPDDLRWSETNQGELAAFTSYALVGLCKLTPPDPQLKGAWSQPLHLSSKNPVSQFAFQTQRAPLRPGVPDQLPGAGGHLRRPQVRDAQLPGRVARAAVVRVQTLGHTDRQRRPFVSQPSVGLCKLTYSLKAPG